MNSYVPHMRILILIYTLLFVKSLYHMNVKTIKVYFEYILISFELTYIASP